jgi:hypothetical protein
VFYGLLAALFAYVTVTVAAFAYLAWWQAVLASAATFWLIILGLRVLVKAAVGRLGQFARGLMAEQSAVLRGATADIHAVRPVADAEVSNLRWYEVELTVFPDRGSSAPWRPDALVATRPDAGPAGEAFPLHDLRVLVDGDPLQPVGPASGPQRLRFRVGVPAGVRTLALRYVVHPFGRIDLPAVALPGRGMP